MTSRESRGSCVPEGAIWLTQLRFCWVTRDQVKYGKPDPGLFIAAAERLGVDIARLSVVGDSIRDMMAARRARARNRRAVGRLRPRRT